MIVVYLVVAILAAIGFERLTAASRTANAVRRVCCWC